MSKPLRDKKTGQFVSMKDAGKKEIDFAVNFWIDSSKSEIEEMAEQDEKRMHELEKKLMQRYPETERHPTPEPKPEPERDALMEIRSGAILVLILELIAAVALGMVYVGSRL